MWTLLPYPQIDAGSKVSCPEIVIAALTDKHKSTDCLSDTSINRKDKNICWGRAFPLVKRVLFFFRVYLFTFGSNGFSLLPSGFLKLQRAGTTPSLLYSGFSLWWFLLLQSTGSRACGLSCCDSQAWLLQGRWILSDQRSNSYPLHCQGGFLTTGPPGKPKMCTF